jgi:hypothetical protein
MSALAALNPGADRIQRVAPLGLRLWDAVAGSVVADGLSVVAYPAAAPYRRMPGVVTLSGSFGFRGLPGMHAVETGAVAPGAAVPQPFVVEVVDTLGRFQPFTLALDVPETGLYVWDCGPTASPLSPPDPPPGLGAPAVPLFSSPSRAVPPGMAVLRADLWDPVAGAGAAWAVLEVVPAGAPPAFGLADANGRVAVVFPYPEPPSPPLGPGSPPAGAGGPPSWPVEVFARYAPAAPPPAAPELCAAFGQAAATLWADSALTQPLGGLVLQFGQELVARTVDAATSAPLSVVYVTAGASPP